MATATSDKIPTASVQPQPIPVVTGNRKTNGKVKTTSITVQENKVEPNDEKVQEIKVKVPNVAVTKNKWTEGTESEEPRASVTGGKALTVVIIVLKFIVLGQLIAAVGLQIQSLFNSTWGYDDYLDFGYEGRIYHTLWGFYEDGDPVLFSQHKEGNWQDWKKPIIKFQCIALALGIAGTLIQVILVALTFVHPHKAVKIALLIAVILLSGGCGGLVVKTTMNFKGSRPVLGFAISAVSSTTLLQTFTHEGYTQAFVSGATYLAAALFSVILIVLTAVKHTREPTKVTPIKSTQDE
ncbi:uncharacterized protein LOC110456264 [Mizuhopecten yessoensis]|uniref:Uncharacterized protein n=1 Tax=Mizuhopecten yessoensis TaxID=6573 RepID=A0A210QBC9_MIZYE|nr:uncharacterized protein LOC110456264 [Mizuhopecten yessoensis]OWF46038.1 hypothetical protein KP79_PYT01477 [Mizuhopecten yessoensis]